MTPDIPLHCDHCGFQLDFDVKCGQPFPPECENGCQDGYGSKVKMKLRKGGRRKELKDVDAVSQVDLGELVLFRRMVDEETKARFELWVRP